MSENSDICKPQKHDFNELKEQLTNLTKAFTKKEQFGSVTGTCKEFCPQTEVLTRQINNDICLPYESQYVIKKYYKKYNRYSDDSPLLQPEDFRTIETLENCFSYLLKIYFDEPTSRELYCFFDNRLQTITLDIYAQEFKCLKSAHLLKKIIRFHLLMKYDFFETAYFKGGQNKQVIKALNYAIDIYANHNPILNIELFKYYILLHIEKREQIGEYYYLRNMKEFKLIFQIFEAFHTDNANDFFQSFSKLSFFDGCSVLGVIYPFRAHMIHLYKIVFRRSLIETTIINERLLLQPEDMYLLLKNGVLLIKNTVDFYSFNSGPSNSRSKNLRKYEKYLPANLKHIYPKSILQEINTPDSQVSQYINPDFEILRDLKYKTRILKIYKFLKSWSVLLQQQLRKVLIVYEDTFIIKSYLNKLIKQSLHENITMDLMTLKEFDIKKGLEYHLSFFIVNEIKKRGIKESYFMLNLLVKSPIELSDFLLDSKKIPAELIKEEKLSNLLKGKSESEKEYIVNDLISNKRNPSEIKDCLKENSVLEKYIVYY